ncbi:MAG: HAD-IG family 5'-nucleotidase [Deltaproteobacteria bacterium]|nr:HAD-IG family 5'-nucleotidase [Deltaproteobacteria bacterium]
MDRLVPAVAFPPPERRVYCNRTLNLRSIRAVGFDMDYTLIHYRVDEWERRAYEHLRDGLVRQGWPVADLAFDPDLFIRGLVIDRERGNIVKANRFGYVKRASHGTRLLEFDAQRKEYERTTVDLDEPRWVFLHTLFSHSEACMYAQLADLLDAGSLPGVMGYGDLYDRMKRTLDRAHLEGALKAEIVADPDRFVEPDPELPLALLDLRHAGRKLMLITNSEWSYTRAMMAYALDRFLGGRTWRDLFDIVIVSARKPDFFSSRQPMFEVVSDDGLLRPCLDGPRSGGVFHGGDAGQVERHLRASGEEILYVGDHMWADVHVSKSALRWRTALILRELEDEIRATEAFVPDETRLGRLMAEKERLEFGHARARLDLQRLRGGYGPKPSPDTTAESLQALLADLRARLAALDDEIGPLAQRSADVGNPRWGPLMRAGNDKSHLARQVERSADIYMSRVSNFLHVTPFVYLRSPRGTLPHDVANGVRAADPDAVPPSGPDSQPPSCT